jgi:hypothetical protein
MQLIAKNTANPKKTHIGLLSLTSAIRKLYTDKNKKRPPISSSIEPAAKLSRLLYSLGKDREAFIASVTYYMRISCI